MNERMFADESRTTKEAWLNCPWCKTRETYDLRWLVRRKKRQLAPGAGEEARMRFRKFQSYMVLLDDKVGCKRCRRTFDVSGIKTMAYLTDEPVRG